MQPNIIDIDLTPLPQWLEQAGQLAMVYFRQVVPQQKSNGSLLTEADLTIERFLISQLQKAYPTHDILAEESDPAEQKSDFLWTIDPLDGTTAFVHGLPDWGIAVGLLHKGKPVWGVFHMPMLGRTIVNDGGDKGEGAPTTWGIKGFLAVSSSSAHRKFSMKVQRFRTVSSVSTALVYVAQGVAAAAFIPKARLWDLVPGMAIIEQAGGEMRYLSGKPVDYEALNDGRITPEPVIAGHPNLLDELQQSISPVYQ